MINYTKIAEMGEYRKKKKPAPKKIETKKKKEEAPKAKTAPVTPITRKEIKDEPKSKPSFKPPKAKARPERKETSENGRFRGFAARPRETKKETMPKTTGPGNTSSIMKQTRRPKQYKKIEQGPYTSGNVLKNIVEQIPKKPRDQRAGGGKVGNKYFTGGMVNPSFGTDYDDR